MKKTKAFHFAMLMMFFISLLTSCSSGSNPSQVSLDDPLPGSLITTSESMYDTITITQDGDEVFIQAATKDDFKADEPHRYKVSVDRKLTADDISVIWYSDEDGKQEKDPMNGNTLSARITITVDGNVVFNHLESFIENHIG